MPIKVLSDASVLINGIDLSDHVEGVTINYSAEVKEAKVMGDAGIRRLSGLLDWSAAITFRQDLDAAKVNATLFPLIGGAPFAFAARESKADAISVANPEWQGNGLIDGDYAVVAGEVGEVHNTSVTIVGADGVALIPATS